MVILETKTNDLTSKKSEFMYKNLVLSGGGVKGISLIGALKYLDENNLLNQIKVFAGSSVGVFISALYIIGYSIDEMYKFTMSLDLSCFKTEFSLSNFLSEFGFENGNSIEFIIQKLIENKIGNKDITLQELFEKTKKKLIIAVTCINTNRVEYLDYTNNPSLPLWIAVRMTTSIPIFYKPVVYNNKIYVDGGLIDNFPIQLFNIKETLGIVIIDNVSQMQTIDSIDLEQYLIGVFKCLLYGNIYDKIDKYKESVVSIEVSSTNFIDFDMDKDFKNSIFNSGYYSMEDYLLKNYNHIIMKNILNEIIQKINI